MARDARKDIWDLVDALGNKYGVRVDGVYVRPFFGTWRGGVMRLGTITIDLTRRYRCPQGFAPWNGFDPYRHDPKTRKRGTPRSRTIHLPIERASTAVDIVCGDKPIIEAANEWLMSSGRKLHDNDNNNDVIMTSDTAPMVWVACGPQDLAEAVLRIVAGESDEGP